MKAIVLIPGYMCDDQIWINQLAKLKKEYKVIVGSDDKLSSKEMNIELNKNIRGSELFFIKQSGHFVMIEQSQKFNKLFYKWLEY